MKKHRGVFFLIVLSAILLPMILSCSARDGNETGEPDLSVGINRYENGGSRCIYGNYYVYFDLERNCLRYQDLRKPTAESVPVFQDALSDKTEDPFYSFSASGYLVPDLTALAAEREKPVIIASVADPVMQRGKTIDYSKIIVFDVASQKTRVVKERITGKIQSLDMYKNTIFYATNDGDRGYNLHAVCADGSSSREMANEQKALWRLEYIHEDRIYYYDEGTGMLYSCDLNFENRTELFPIVNRVRVFVFDGYVYYGDHVETDENAVRFLDFCRTPLSDLSQQEILVPGVTGGRACGAVLYYYHKNQTYREEAYTDSLGTRALYAFDAKEQKSFLIYEKEEKGVSRLYLALSPKYLVFRERSGRDTYSCLDLETKKESALPHLSLSL